MMDIKRNAQQVENRDIAFQENYRDIRLPTCLTCMQINGPDHSTFP